MRKLIILAILLATGSTTTLLNAQIVGDDPTLFAAKNNGFQLGIGKLPVVDDDSLGAVQLQGWVPGGDYYTGAEMRAYVSGPVQLDGFAADLRFQTGYPQLLPRMSITADGKVGIGTTTPGFALHTVGNTHTTGDFYGRLHVDINGSLDSAPDTYTDEMYLERHANATFANPSGSAAAEGGLLTLAPGGSSYDHQLFFAEDGIFHRRWAPEAADWAGANWFKLLTGEDISGTPNRVAKFTSENGLGDSQLWDDGTKVGIGTDAPASGFLLEVAGHTLISGTTVVDGDLEVKENAKVQDELGVGKDAEIGRDLEVGRDTWIGQNLGVTNNAVVGNQLKVGSTTQIGGVLTVTNDANITGQVSASSGMIDNQLAVGTTDTPGSHSLYVGGSAIAEEVVVKLAANWPDYVFAEGYHLLPLEEVSAFIQAKQHLPGFPSAKDIEQEGAFSLGATQRLLVEKVEELTLYAIQAEAEKQALQQQLRALEARIEALEK